MNKPTTTSTDARVHGCLHKAFADALYALGRGEGPDLPETGNRASIDLRFDAAIVAGPPAWGTMVCVSAIDVMRSSHGSSRWLYFAQDLASGADIYEPAVGKNSVVFINDSLLVNIRVSEVGAIRFTMVSQEQIDTEASFAEGSEELAGIKHVFSAIGRAVNIPLQLYTVEYMCVEPIAVVVARLKADDSLDHSTPVWEEETLGMLSAEMPKYDYKSIQLVCDIGGPAEALRSKELEQILVRRSVNREPIPMGKNGKFLLQPAILTISPRVDELFEKNTLSPSFLANVIQRLPEGITQTRQFVSSTVLRGLGETFDMEQLMQSGNNLGALTEQNRSRTHLVNSITALLEVPRLEDKQTFLYARLINGIAVSFGNGASFFGPLIYQAIAARALGVQRFENMLHILVDMLFSTHVSEFLVNSFNFEEAEVQAFFNAAHVQIRGERFKQMENFHLADAIYDMFSSTQGEQRQSKAMCNNWMAHTFHACLYLCKPCQKTLEAITLDELRQEGTRIALCDRCFIRMGFVLYGNARNNDACIRLGRTEPQHLTRGEKTNPRLAWDFLRRFDFYPIVADRPTERVVEGVQKVVADSHSTASGVMRFLYDYLKSVHGTRQEELASGQTRGRPLIPVSGWTAPSTDNLSSWGEYFSGAQAGNIFAEPCSADIPTKAFAQIQIGGEEPMSVQEEEEEEEQPMVEGTPVHTVMENTTNDFVPETLSPIQEESVIEEEAPVPVPVAEEEAPVPVPVAEEEAPAPVAEEEAPAPAPVAEEEAPAPTPVAEEEEFPDIPELETASRDDIVVQLAMPEIQQLFPYDDIQVHELFYTWRSFFPISDMMTDAEICGGFVNFVRYFTGEKQHMPRMHMEAEYMMSVSANWFHTTYVEPPGEQQGYETDGIESDNQLVFLFWLAMSMNDRDITEPRDARRFKDAFDRFNNDSAFVTHPCYNMGAKFLMFKEYLLWEQSAFQSMNIVVNNQSSVDMFIAYQQWRAEHEPSGIFEGMETAQIMRFHYLATTFPFFTSLDIELRKQTMLALDVPIQTFKQMPVDDQNRLLGLNPSSKQSEMGIDLLVEKLPIAILEVSPEALQEFVRYSLKEAPIAARRLPRCLQVALSLQENRPIRTAADETAHRNNQKRTFTAPDSRLFARHVGALDLTQFQKENILKEMVEATEAWLINTANVDMLLNNDFILAYKYYSAWSRLPENRTFAFYPQQDGQRVADEEKAAEEKWLERQSLSIFPDIICADTFLRELYKAGVDSPTISATERLDRYSRFPSGLEQFGVSNNVFDIMEYFAFNDYQQFLEANGPDDELGSMYVRKEYWINRDIVRGHGAVMTRREYDRVLKREQRGRSESRVTSPQKRRQSSRSSSATSKRSRA